MVKPTTTEDVIRICEQMWNRGKAELEAYGNGWGKLMFDFGRAIAQGQCYTVVDDYHGPVCAVGVSDGRSMFAATRSMDEVPTVGKRATAALRGAMLDLAKKHNLREFEILSLCIDDRAPKWFQLLNAPEDHEYRGPTYAGHRERRFVFRVKE